MIYLKQALIYAHLYFLNEWLKKRINDIYEDTFYLNELKEDSYYGLIRNVESYLKLNFKILNRWAYLIVIDNIEMSNHLIQSN